jgi:hypothetical protein
MNNERCFLDEDKWRSMKVDTNNFPLMPKNCSIYHEGLNHFAIIPGLLKKFKTLNKEDASIQCADVYSAVEEARSNMIEWHERLQSEFEQPIRICLPVSPSSYTMFPSVYKYKDIITATFVVNYSAYLLQANNMLDSLNSSTEYLDENIALSRDICMSADYCSRAGFCGIQVMAFALPFALSALPERYDGWIRCEIMVFDKLREAATVRSAMLARSGT